VDRFLIASLPFFLVTACSRDAAAPPPRPEVGAAARNVLLITIDTLRADRVGAYGYAAARTPTLDDLARAGVRFDAAYAAAPITLTSHASLLTGRYPPGHAARHNGMRVDSRTPTIAETLAQHGFATAAFIAAFPLDRRFGLSKGFQTYNDRMPRGEDGRPANERPGRLVVDEAIDWLVHHSHQRFFLWVHLFEPHAPYGNPADPNEAQRPVSVRYDDEIAEADRQAGRLIGALGDARRDTLIIAAADHGEAFGEHGEISHSVFTYDTTLRVPLLAAGPGVPAGLTVREIASLVDIAPTIAARTGLARFDADGIDLSPALTAGSLPARTLYAESFAPLLDFGWSPLRSVRDKRWKYIAAPKPELYDLQNDPGETHNVVATEGTRASELARRTDAISSATLAANPASLDREARVQALGYAAGSSAPADRADPKDRRELAAHLAEVTSGELHGPALERALRQILKEDPDNPQAHVRLGYMLVAGGKCRDAVTHFRAAIDEHLPSVDAHLGLAGCAMAAGQRDVAERTLRGAERVEPDNPVVLANLGIAISDGGHPADGLSFLHRALSIDPDLHQARFALAIAYARLGRRAEAAREAEELLRRLPAAAPQRAEVDRLLTAVRPASE
jgi:arylsulfatase A-like enzyme